MSVPANVIKGSLVLQSIPETFCFKDALEFLEALPKLLGVEIPASVTNVIVSNVEPLDSQTTDIWFRLSNSGGFIGIYIFSAGNWQQIFPAPNAIIRMYGDSADIPPGYALADGTNPKIPPGAVASIVAQWHSNGAGGYDVFDVTFDGF